MNDILNRGFEAQANIMQEFGYPSVTVADVAEAHRKWKAGEDASDVIAMFCVSAFEEHVDIFGEQDR